MSTAYILTSFSNLAQVSPRPGGRAGPRYACMALVVGAVMVPAAYGWFWALEHAAGINAFYSLVHPPTLFVWALLFVVVDAMGRQKWAKHDSNRTRQEQRVAEATEGAGQKHDGIMISQPRVKATPRRAQKTETLVADTILSLVVLLATMSVCALCKCCNVWTI